MVSAHAYPTFELSDAAPLLAKQLLESESCGGVWKSCVQKSCVQCPERLDSDTHG